MAQGVSARGKRMVRVTQAYQRTALPLSRCLPVNVQILYFFGLWTSNCEEQRDWFFYWRLIYPRIQFFRLSYSLVFQAINMYLVWGDIMAGTEYFMMFVIYGVVLVKLATIFFQQNNLKRIFSTLERLQSPPMLHYKHLKQATAKTNNFTRKLSLYVFTGGTLATVVGCSLLIMQGFTKRTIPFRRWLPYNTDKSPSLEITLLGTYVATAFDLTTLFACDLTFIAVSAQVVGQFEILIHKLYNMEAYVGDIKKKKRDLTNLAECFNRGVSDVSAINAGPGNDVIVDPSEMDVGRSCDVRVGVMTASSLTAQREGPTGPTMTRRKYAEYANKRKEDLRMERYLKHCAKHHLILLGLSNDLGAFYKTPLACQVVSNLLCGLVALYITTLVPTIDMKVVACVMIIIGCYGEYLFFCWFGNRITEESANVREAVYGCDWVGTTPSFKRSVQIMIARTNRPVIIRAGGLPLSMRTFKKMYKASYYLHMLLSKLINGEKII